MNPSHSSNWPEETQEKANFKQSQLDNSTLEQLQPKAFQFLYLKEKPSEFESLLTLFEGLPCISFILNSTGVVLAISQFGAAYLGYESLELAQKLISQVFYLEDQAKCQAKLTDLQQQPSQISQWSARLVGKDGKIMWVRARARLAPETQANPIILLVCEDITASQHEEETQGERKALRQNTPRNWSSSAQQMNSAQMQHWLSSSPEDNYRTLAKNIPNGAAFLFDKDLRFIVAEGAEIQASGLTKEHFEGKTLREAFEPETCALLEPFYLQALAGKATTTELSLAEQIYILQIAPLKNEQGEIYGGVAFIIQNIIEHKRVEEARREREARFRHIINTNLIGFFFFDYNGAIAEANNAFLQLVDYTREELLAGELRWDTLTPTTYQPLDKQAIQEMRVSGACTPYEKEFIRKDGSRVPIILAAVRSEEDQETGKGFAFVLDLTKRKIAEEALQQQLMKERLVGAISQRIHQSLNLEEILDTTVAEVRQFLACDRVIIFRIDSDGSGVVVVESVGSDWRSMSGTLINDRYFAQIYIRLYKQGRVQAIEDIYAAGLTQCHVDLLAQFQARANLVVPIVQEEQLWGLLVAQQCTQTRKWQPLEIDLLKSLATQAAIAIQQSELYQQAQTEISQRQQAEEALRQQFQRERLVGAIAQRIRKSLNLDKILNATVAEVRQVLQTDRVIIFRFEPNWSGNVAVESVGSSWPAILGTNIYDSCFEKQYVWLYQKGRVKAIEDIYTQKLSRCHFDLLARFEVRANLVVPILNKEQLWGLLIVHHCSEGRQWQQFEIDLLTSLASQVAIAIQQSQLYEQAKSHFLREQALNQVTQVIRSSLDLSTVFSTAVREIGELLQVDRVQILQYLPERKLWLQVSDYGKSPNLLGSIGKKIPDENNEIIERLKRLEIVKIHEADSCEDESEGMAQAFPGAWLLVPLHFGSSVWGSIVLGRGVRLYCWQDSEVELICKVADQVAIAIQQSQLYEQAQYHFLREQALNQVTQAIRRSLDLPTIFSTATREIEKLLQVDCAQIVQYLPESQLWVTVAERCKGLGSPVGIGGEIQDENNEIANRLKRLEVVRIDDTSSFENKINRSIAQKFSGAWLLVPLQFNSSLWGALGLKMDVGPYHWQDSQVELSCEVADQLAIALQQAELYNQSCLATQTAVTQAQKLEKALQELQRTQAQLVQSEKMSSLGQLVAGVAHEINNPVSFIYGNLIHASGYTKDLLGLIQLYQQKYPIPTPEIQLEIEEIDLDFLIGDLPKLLDSMKIGAERICEIVSSLRNFSRLAEAEMKAVNIHDGLDSTLVILQNRLKAQGEHPQIQVIREYSNLPNVECYAGQLNQVFMNLFTNAIDAIDEQNQTRTLEEIQANPSTILVHTELLDDHHIAIRIADNGPGMTEQVKARLFDPFFTTKPVGTGTGLGLSISYQIVVERHGGQLLCCSELGQGTEFVIQIPIAQRTKK